MTPKDKEPQELAVAALRDGTVIDHIPSHSVFKAVRILGLEDLHDAAHPVTIGFNLPSSRMGTKGIIKVAGTSYPPEVIDRIAIIAPTARINTIRDYAVVDKRSVRLPDRVVGLVRCDNPKCITNNEPMDTVFEVVDRSSDAEGVPVVTLRCHYCGHGVTNDKAHIV